MASIKLLDFGGEIPSRAPRLLPPNNATVCENVWLSEGCLDTYALPVALTTLASSTRYVYRIPTGSDTTDYNASFWKEFDDVDTKMVKAPVANDSFERFYWAIPGAAPQYNTKARIIAGDPDFVLGIPTPAGNVTVTPDASGAGANEVRAYCFTYVSAYGEEGPPSPAVVATGKIDDVWNITIPAVGADATQRNITERNLYRTVTGLAGDTNYYLVTTLPIATLAYADTRTAAQVTAGGLIQSLVWVAPPTTLEGLVVMPNGITAGFTGRDIYFSEPYRPHAWPVQYSISVEYPIVGLGVVGTTLVVLTNGNPYAISGIHPDSMAEQKLPNVTPCLSASSIVSAPEGVYYASTDGLVLISGGVVTVVTKDVVANRVWQNEYDPAHVLAVMHKGAYLAMRDRNGLAGGFIVDVTNVKTAFNQLVMPTNAHNVQTDPWTGDPVFIMSSALYRWDSPDTDARLSYRWKSKEFQLNQPANLAALKIFFDGIPANSQSGNADPWAEASIDLLPTDVSGELKLYANRVLVWAREFPDVSGELMKLPSGYKTDIYQLEITARVKVHSVQAATNVKELSGI